MRVDATKDRQTKGGREVEREGKEERGGQGTDSGSKTEGPTLQTEAEEGSDSD